MGSDKHRVCSVSVAGPLAGRIRRWLHDPRKILSPLVREGMTVLDVGCGPGFFSTALAEIVGANGRVIAADLQDGMLEIVRDRIRGTDLVGRIHLLKCERDSINVAEKVDFALAFWMVHEVPDQAAFLRQLKSVLREDARVLLVEPRMFHVSRRDFDATLALARQAGFAVEAGPRVRLSWSAVLANRANSSTAAA